jgi:acyl carrier protein
VHLEIEEISKQLILYIEEKCLVKFGSTDLSVETDLFDSNIIDSVGVIELISFLEEKFDVHLTDEDLLSPVLSSVVTMAEFVHARHCEKSGSQYASNPPRVVHQSACN